MTKDKKKQIKDKARNMSFAAALAYLRSIDKDAKLTHGKLAEKIGIDEDTITNILNYYTRVSDTTINKLFVNTDKIFNLQFLLGQSSVMLAEDLAKEDATRHNAEFAALLAAKDDTIASLKRALSAKDDTIAAKDSIIATKEALISTLRQQISSSKES